MPAPNKAWRGFIPSGGMNDVVAAWHSKQPPREQSVASPSTLTECPRVVWLKKHKVAYTNDMGWGVKQRLMLGRIAENLFAKQLQDEGKLLWHWKDDVAGESVKFGMGDGLSRIEGTPDLLISLDGKVLISDAKTSRADSFAYVPLDKSVWKDELWYKYKLQVEAYYLLCHKNKDWFQLNNTPQGKAAALPLPEACHLFSYALDDGVVKREFTWTPTQETAEEILSYTTRWNAAYQSRTMPACKCTETQVKFCPYASEMETTRTGYKLGIKCCASNLEDEIVKQEVLENVVG
jgi:hypothetical protein